MQSKSSKIKSNRKYYYKNKNKFSEYRKKFQSSTKGRYSTLIHTAKDKGLILEISFDEFSKIVVESCVYCGEDKLNRGLDRIDSTLGYLKNNVVSCCKKCNYMKWIHSEEEFLLHIEKIYHYQQNAVSISH